MNKQEKTISESVRGMYEEFPFPNDSLQKEEELTKHKWILKSLPSPIKQGSKILDAGCGTGEISCFLSRFGNVTGIDFSENSIKLANQLKTRLGIKNLKFILDNLTELRHKEKYDYIFSIGVLHHIPQMELAIKNLKSLMHKNSFLVISVYNKYSNYHHSFFKPRYSHLARKMDAFNNPYAIYYSKNEMLDILKKHSLEIVGFYRNIPKIIRVLTGRGRLMTFCLKKKEIN